MNSEKIKVQIINTDSSEFELKNVEENDWTSLKTHGVWALFGKARNESNTKCLQVGQSQNIASEIVADSKCLLEKIEEIQDVAYINQFGKKTDFTYTSYPTTRVQLLKHIGVNYSDLLFICICYGTDYEKDLKSIEKYVAWEFKALYWRNGGSFKSEKEVVRPEKLEDGIPEKIQKNVNIIKTTLSLLKK